ncbi:uncharacterized protein AKAW2_11891A [Aspergillus luchuensis]|uniref:Uncharacterized protein n=2 Tax=Aspergillus subgen. Circumdati TaxID=2720871 RepID=A0A8G1RBY3_9EURO|nr:hypothetical protein BO85DRAFT_15576 [Aspergillus piperis CBS 112811]XP_041538611.1 uncharacterized protein AKAW2_11891A [Aspergillus luchuensis]GAA86130.1 similar to An07g02750 [Aspergillus luchuensis IFO 4308]RAH63033.1 hypothetical protein BO85DRAFT_15576 [Aspergillus piperis CBS 112811]BCR94845.1 hypothetical protein AKAW2_11891A [Aspergillus luchuensis]BCS07424.1 hypothetical protein ALUC_11805A [Aspergillus luchuensis]
MSPNPRIIPTTESTTLPRTHQHQPNDADADAPLHTQSSPEREQEDPSSRILGRSIKPPVVRHYSWSEEDRKHALQARLLETEGREMGFSEVRGHDGGVMGDE